MWWHTVTHGRGRGNWRMEWIASTLHTTSEHGVSSITTADAHTSAASSRLNWRPRRFKWTRPFRRKTKCGFWACAVTFQTQSALSHYYLLLFCYFLITRLAFFNILFMFFSYFCFLFSVLVCVLCLLFCCLFSYLSSSLPTTATQLQ